MKNANAVVQIGKSGVIAIMRAKSPDQLLAAAEAILAGGVDAIEVTMTTPGALEVVRQATSRYGDEVMLGVGSVLDAETARAALLAGAMFVVSPTLSAKVIELCKRYSVPVIPGAYTPTEILTAWESGADFVKVFPAEVGGPGYIKAVKAPLPQVRLIPVGGVDLETTAEFIRAGADAVGVGSALISQKLLDQGDFAEITRRARRFREEVAQGRSSKA
ncbi:MAG TPA: bifunctional 4-hydroxy-2-oxoglutarate aldolase/2-dehydro-3-deoxy-phosphogluconate aldolase [Anaerolineales bacterium]|nr:bifunctional 4-hydroxy-2-oxoglutarate aldolase/2-dehydro-3-deoxy-phosphogluconate aldolase [Anaerolineales bacterium]